MFQSKQPFMKIQHLSIEEACHSLHSSPRGLAFGMLAAEELRKVVIRKIFKSKGNHLPA